MEVPDSQQRAAADDTPLPSGSQQPPAPATDRQQRAEDTTSSVSQRRPLEEQRQPARKPSASTSAKQRQQTATSRQVPAVKPKRRIHQPGTASVAGVTTARDGFTLTDAASAVASAFSPRAASEPLPAGEQREGAPTSSTKAFLFGNTQPSGHGSQESATQVSLPSFQVPRTTEIEDSLGLRPLNEVLSELSDESQSQSPTVGLEDAIVLLCGSPAGLQGEQPVFLQLSPESPPALPGKRERVSPDNHNHGKKTKCQAKKPFKV